jgi:hypothetical protein
VLNVVIVGYLAQRISRRRAIQTQPLVS